ncbi:ABC transporter substrate-binding protein [Patescibacteria group bacterium]|nr:ABC transporter substrate-binding protein [Patescibacteria group bacterium]
MKKIAWVILPILVLAILIGVVWRLGLFSFDIMPKNLTPATVKLKWLHQSQFAGMYVAKEKGYYSREGLNVDLAPFSFEEPTIDAVAEGKADFGVTGADELIIARSKGLPLKAIAVIYKINPYCAYSLKESGIVAPQDFVGKRIGLAQGIAANSPYFLMMKKLDIDRGNITEIVTGYDSTELLNGSVDVLTGYIINEPHQVLEQGKQVNTILSADYGVNIYADVLFTRDDILNENPLLAEKFLRATLDGWRYAIENIEESVGITLKYATDRTESHELYMLRTSIPLINTGKSPIGFMEESEWENAQNILLEQNLLTKKIDIHDVYTMDVFNKISQPQ